MAPRQNRHILRELCPPWLRGEQAYSFLNEGIFTLYDIDAELMWQSLLARFPTYCPVDALPYLAADKRIIIGPSESEEATRARIRLWLIEAVLSGLPIGWLIALQAFGAPTYPRVRIVNKKSTWHTLEANAVPRLLGLQGYAALPPCPYESGAQWPISAIASPVERLRFSGLYSREQAAPANWDWDSISNPERAACWWDCVGIIYGHYSQQLNWDSGLWVWDDPETSLGLADPYGTFTTLRYLAVQRKSCKSVLRCVIWTNDNTAFDPSLPAGDPTLPDGYWGRPGKIVAGKLVPSRSTAHRYLDIFPND